MANYIPNTPRLPSLFLNGNRIALATTRRGPVLFTMQLVLHLLT